MYIVLHTILEWMYFDASVTERWINLACSIIINIYFLLYQLYIYYDMMKYPVAHIGNKKFQYYAIRYGSLLKSIRFEQYDVKKPWSPKQWFRPYNYHILSFYKKLMMIASVPLFYHKTHAQPVLIILQIAEIIRFCYVRPFCSVWRNVYRLLLELVLLAFFFCVLIEGFLMHQIMLNNADTLVDTVNKFYTVGWIGFGLVFLFNASFLFIMLLDMFRGCSKSNMQLMS